MVAYNKIGNTMAVVREATENDLFDILFLATSFSREAHEVHKVDRVKVGELLTSLVQGENSALLLYEVEGKVVGFLAGLIHPMLFSHAVVASEVAWFVEKEARGSYAGKKLLEAFEAWAKEQGADWVTMGDITVVGNLGPVYEKLGYENTERAYSKRIK